MPTEKNNADMNLNTQILIAAILGLAFGFHSQCIQIQLL